MCGLAFASILLLRKSEQQAGILAVLPPERRSAVEAELKTLANAEPGQIHERLRKHREEQRQRAEERFGRSLDHVLPRLAAWLGRPF